MPTHLYRRRASESAVDIASFHIWRDSIRITDSPRSTPFLSIPVASADLRNVSYRPSEDNCLDLNRLCCRGAKQGAYRTKKRGSNIVTCTIADFVRDPSVASSHESRDWNRNSQTKEKHLEQASDNLSRETVPKMKALTDHIVPEHEAAPLDQSADTPSNVEPIVNQQLQVELQGSNVRNAILVQQPRQNEFLQLEMHKTQNSVTIRGQRQTRGRSQSDSVYTTAQNVLRKESQMHQRGTPGQGSSISRRSILAPLSTEEQDTTSEANSLQSEHLFRLTRLRSNPDISRRTFVASTPSILLNGVPLW